MSRKSLQPFNLSGAPKCVTDAAANIPVQLKDATDEGPAELLIDDHIGEDVWGGGVSAASVGEFLASRRGEDINVIINSFGGYCYEGFQMFNDLSHHTGKVTVEIKGIAFSAASFIAMAGDVIRMHKASDWGIHRASIMAFGNQKEMRSMADWLNTLDEHVIDIYQDRSLQPRDKIIGWIDGESDGTTFSAQQCLELGFCDEVIEPKKIAKNHGSQSSVNRRSVMAARNRLKRFEVSRR